MKKVFLLFITAMLMVSCVKSPPLFKSWTEEQQQSAIERGGFHYDDGIGGNWYAVTETDRLQLMQGPVVVVSKGEISHGVFREKYKTYAMVVRDGKGRFWTFYSPSWGTMNVGDTVKP